MSRPIAEDFAALASMDLNGSVLELPAGPMPDPIWRSFISGAVARRLHGHLAEAVRAGRLQASETQRTEALDLHLDAMVHVLRLEHRLAEVSALLASAGIDHRVLKGPALARLAYDRPGLRIFGDLDLLIPTDQLEAALAALSAAGCRRREVGLRPGFDGRFGKGVTMVAPDGIELDVHRTFVMGPFGLTVDLDGMFEAGERLELAGRHIPTLGLERLLLHACYTVAVGDNPPRLVALRDVAQLVLHRPVETGLVLELAERCGASALVATAVAATWRTLGIADAVPLSAWAAAYQPDATERRWLQAYGRDSYGSLARASLSAIPRYRDRLSYARAVAVPSREFLDERSEGRTRWFLRGAWGSFAARKG